MEDNRHTRREFLRKTGGVAAGALGLSLLGTACSIGKKGPTSANAAAADAAPRKKPSGATVVVARDDRVWKGGKLDADALRELLFKAVRTLSGETGDRVAWGRYYSAPDIVGVKVNTIAGRKLSTSPELVAGIVAGLKAAGVRNGNIIVWDRYEDELSAAGFDVGESGGVKYIGTDSSGIDYDADLSQSGEVTTRVSRIASRMCTSLLNASVMKDHDLAGFSGCLKNYFGAINNPNKLHGNGCNPTVADNYALPVFRDKTKLCICDATLAQYNGGPGFKPAYSWKFGGVLVSTDPVALDTIALGVIEKKRKEKGLKTIAAEGRPAAYLKSAAAAPRFLGVADAAKIKVVHVSLT